MTDHDPDPTYVLVPAESWARILDLAVRLHARGQGFIDAASIDPLPVHLAADAADARSVGYAYRSAGAELLALTQDAEIVLEVPF